MTTENYKNWWFVFKMFFFPFYMQPNVSTEAKKISIYLNMVGKKINWIVIYLKL